MFLMRPSAQELSYVHLASPGVPSDYGYTTPSVICSLTLAKLYRFLYRASAVEVSVTFTADTPGFSGVDSVEISGTTTIARGSGGVFNGIGFASILKNMYTLGPISPVGGGGFQVIYSADGLSITTYYSDSTSETNPCSIDVYLDLFPRPGEVISEIRPRPFFSEDSYNYKIPFLNVGLAGYYNSGITGTFLGSAFSSYENENPDIDNIVSDVEIEISGSDLPLI